MPSAVRVKNRLSNINDLQDVGLLSQDGQQDGYARLETQYDVGVSAHVVGQISNLDDAVGDPVGRQYIPTLAELDVHGGEEGDPIGDDAHSPVRGIVHRYPDRVLLKISNVCGVYCRYCFRREMIGAGSDHLSDDDLEAAIDYIKAHNEIWEVILTGGDPLVLSPRRLQKVVDALNVIDHVKIIRIHTRIPVSNPDKIDDTILSVLKSINKSVHVVLHINHSQEISDTVRNAVFSLQGLNFSVLSQSVLLKNVNDDADVLEKLFRALVEMNVQPYYLHHLDRAKGVAHFLFPIKRGREIMDDLQGRVSGICLPKYMLDIPEGYGKIPINSDYVEALDQGDLYRVRDYKGCTHMYCDGYGKEEVV